jgi:hypothetical protein
MSGFEIKGKLLVKYPTQQVTEKFRKREFVLEIPSGPNGAYTEQIKIQLTQDRCDLLDRYREGADINVSFNLKGRPFTNKHGETVYYTNVEAWRIDNPRPQEDSMPSSEDFPFQQSNGGGDDSGLPF